MMPSFSGSRILIGVAIVCAGGGLAVFVVENGRHPSPPVPPISILHTADWYLAHPDVLKNDATKCDRNDGELPQPACENVDAAQSRLAPSQLQAADGGK